MVSDVVETLRSVDLDVPAGSYESDAQDLLVRAQASVIEPEQIEKLFIGDGVRLGDVGEVFFGPDDAEAYALLNGRMIVGLSIVRQAGANTIAIAEEVEARLANINERARDLTLVKTSDNAVYIKGALKDVAYTLIFSILIVLIVIAVFLGQWRAIFIPAVTMPISLIGTLATIWLFGFSINLLTLLALVLATGLIVDDAIVVLENIQRRRGLGLDKMAAAVLGTRQVFFAVIATTITLVSVFLPIAFLPGETGKLFREFGLVLAIAVIISSFVAVTLCPMMASRLPHLSQSTPWLAALRLRLDRMGQQSAGFYFKTLDALMARRALALGLAAGVAALGVFSFLQLNQELLPEEDRGQLQINLTGPDGASLNYADAQAQKLEAILEPYRQQGLINDVFTVVGWRDPNRVFVIARLQDWEERDISQSALSAHLSKPISDLPGGQARLVQQSSLSMRGSGGGGMEIAILGSNYEAIYQEANRFARTLQQEVPQINDVRVQFDSSQPELSFTIDRERANDLGVPVTRIAETLRVMVDRLDLLDLSIEDQAVPVMIGALEGSIENPSDLLNVYVTSEAGELVPLSSFITVKESGVAAELDRHSQRRAIELDIGTAPGAPLGEVVRQIEALAAEQLPENMALQLLGEAATLEQASSETAITFLIALVVVFLVLTAQFESIGSAAIVMFTVPFGLAAAALALWLTGQTLNLYSQIGLVMLIGLMTKNAILLVEFMDQRRDEGLSVHDAVMDAVQVRLRPVIMTVLSTVMGALPLILSAGPGAEARNAIGWVIFGGLGLSTLFTLYLAPLGYALIAPWTKPRAHTGEELSRQLAHAHQQHLEEGQSS